MTRSRRHLQPALLRGDATIIGVGQGKQSVKWAFPRQMELAKEVHQLGLPHRVLRTVDQDGERGIAVVPSLQSSLTAVTMGRRMGQRSILQGRYELATGAGPHVENTVLTEFGDAKVSEKKPDGFWTFIPEAGLYYSLVPVKPHLRNGRPVVGYATRRARRKK